MLEPGAEIGNSRVSRIRDCRINLGALALLALISVAPLRAQSLPGEPLQKGTWEFGIFAGGGTGLVGAPNTQFVISGVHVGRIMSKERLHGWMRGNFELAGDFMPLFEVIQRTRPTYGGNFTPIIARWNFTPHRRFMPYMELSGGALATRDNVPPGNTSAFNFVAGGSIGTLLFVGSKKALVFESRWLHISNANLGTENPQLVSNFMFTVGFNWFK
jgi:lipid A 3-O-deacylase